MKVCEAYKELFNNSSTLKVIATENRNRRVNIDFRHHLYIDSIGRIIILENTEYSSLNCNLIYSLWFNKDVVISIISENQQSYEFQAKIVRNIISGQEFKSACEWLADEYELFDLSSIWILEPLEIRNSSHTMEKISEEQNMPMIAHLDRLARKEIVYG